jgi:hypothetical protein
MSGPRLLREWKSALSVHPLSDKLLISYERDLK